MISETKDQRLEPRQASSQAYDFTIASMANEEETEFIEDKQNNQNDDFYAQNDSKSNQQNGEYQTA